MHGEMGYLAENNDKRTNPSTILEGAKCALVVGDLYASRDESVDSPLKPGLGRIARYARGKDYHKLIKKRRSRLSSIRRPCPSGNSQSARGSDGWASTR